MNKPMQGYVRSDVPLRILDTALHKSPSDTSVRVLEISTEDGVIRLLISGDAVRRPADRFEPVPRRCIIIDWLGGSYGTMERLSPMLLVHHRVRTSPTLHPMKKRPRLLSRTGAVYLHRQSRLRASSASFSA